MEKREGKRDGGERERKRKEAKGGEKNERKERKKGGKGKGEGKEGEKRAEKRGGERRGKGEEERGKGRKLLVLESRLPLAWPVAGDGEILKRKLARRRGEREDEWTGGAT